MANLASALEFDSGSNDVSTTTHPAVANTTTFDHEEYYRSLSPGEGQTWVIISIGVVSTR